MTKIECIIGLKVPDNTAISAFAALKRMGFAKLTQLERRNYFSFEIDAKKPEAFLKKIQQVDIILNPNKHWLQSPLQRSGANQIFILVQDDLEEHGLLEKLHADWKMNEISSVDHGILWDLTFEGSVDAMREAEKIAKGLLANENYQKYRIFK